MYMFAFLKTFEASKEALPANVMKNLQHVNGSSGNRNNPQTMYRKNARQTDRQRKRETEFGWKQKQPPNEVQEEF
jgi:hypothetical protein